MMPVGAMRTCQRLCPVCGGIACRTLHAMRFALPVGVPLPAAYGVVACSGCGCVYADTPGSGADYARYYAEFSRYEDPTIGTGGGEQAFDRERLAGTAAWIAGQVPPTARVLDVGCGNGGLLLALRAHGFVDLTGMDPSAACVARLRGHGLGALQGGLGEWPAGAGPYDLIVLSHVLEHVLEPRPALVALTSLLAPGGQVYVETPDAARYTDFPSVPFYYFDSEHINHFERASLTNLAGASGFRVVAAGDKTLALADGHGYPAVFALLTAAATPAAVVPSETAGRAVVAYVAQSAAAAGLSAHLRAALAAGRPIALWGAGSQAQRLMQEPAMAGARIVAVVDGDRGKQGGRFAGCTVVAPAAGLAGLPDDCLVVIAAALVANQIQAEYQAMGLPYECVVD